MAQNRRVQNLIGGEGVIRPDSDPHGSDSPEHHEEGEQQELKQSKGKGGAPIPLRAGALALLPGSYH